MMKRLASTLMIGAMAAVGVPLAAAQHADAAALARGTAYFKSFSCGTNRTITELAPNMTSRSGGMENVYFTRSLYQWNGSTQTWVPVFGGAGTANPPSFYGPIPNSYGLTWYSSFADGNGVEGFSLLGTVTHDWVTPTGAGSVVVGQPTYLTGLAPGYYRVQEWYEWSNGSLASAWLPTNTNATYCQIK